MTWAECQVETSKDKVFTHASSHHDMSKEGLLDEEQTALTTLKLGKLSLRT